MASGNLLAQRSKIQRQIETLERLVDTNNFCDNIHIASSDSCHSNDEGSEDSEQEPVSMENLAVKRKQIQREIKELELSLSQDIPGLDIEILSADDENDTESIMETSGEDSDEVFSLPPNVETCLQMNLVYQDVLEEKLTELERLLVENKEQQKEVMVQVSGPAPQATTSGLPPLKVFLGNFMKPYFKDKVTGLGPPANSETRDKMNMGTRSYDEMKIRRWEGWQKTLLLSSVVSDTMKRLLQPKLSKLEYLNEKMAKAEKSEDMEEQILQKQINQIEREIDDISSMSEEQLMGSRHDDHDWEKISNIDFEGTRSAEDIRRFWGNYLHPSVNKSSWKEDEIEKLKNIVENRNYCKWDQIAQELGTNRTAFMCLQTHQRYIHKGFKKKVWTKEEDQVLRELVEKMRIGNFIPYTQISYFMEGREAAQLVYRWTQVLDPTVRKGPWTKEEDEMLLKAVTKYGVRDWWKIRNEVPGRTDAQCRERYLDCLSEDVKKGRWSPEEEAMLINLVRKYGAGRWSKIASEMPNRIDSQCLQKWKIMTGYPAKKRIKKRLPKKTENKRKKLERMKREEEEDTMTSSEEEVVCITSDDELTKDESDLEIDVREEYILPTMEKWIPKTSDSFPHLSLCAGQSVWSNLTDKKTSLSQATLGRPCSVNSLPTLVSPEVRYTILDRIGHPVNTNMRVASPGQQLQEDQHCENDMIKVSLSEVRNLLRWNGGSQMKRRCRLSRWTPRKNNEKSNKGTVRNQGIGVSCEGQSSVAHPAWNTRISVASHVCSTYCTTLNDELLHAITPWMGNLILPLACKKDERCKVDVTREKTKTTGLTSTPVFSLFLKILSIDAEGCKKVIEARTRAEICIPHQQVTPPPKTSPPPPKISASSAPSRKRTVIQMLDEKHKQEYGKKKEDQKQSSLIMVIPQPLVITQPLLQGIEPPVAPTSSAPDKPAIAKGMETYSIYKTIQSQKRTRKPAQKAKVLLAGSKVNLPKKLQNHKKACLQNSCLKDGKKISQVPLCPQPPITWIVTPNGLLPVSGLGIPVSTQAPPAEMKSVSSNVSCFRRLKPIAIKSNNSLTFSINGAPGAEVPPDVLHVCPSVCIPADLPTSSFGERIALNLAPTTSTSTDTLVGRVTCPNNSVSSLSSVSVPHCNSVCAQLPVHFLAAEPVSTIMPVPASVNAGRSVANPTYTVAEVSSLTPLLTYSQGLPILQVCQPQTSQIIATTFVNPVMPPAKITSLPQQQVFSRLKPNDSPLKLATKPALPKSPKPEHILSFDPGLVSAEETSHVTEWMKGVGGIRLTRLDATLPYLPPFVSNLTTLTTLLKCKPDLERCALPLVSPNGESSRVEAPEKGIRRLVAEQLSSNQAYLLLKARFLSCFSLPAFLATVYPHENANSVMFTPAKYSKCEESVSLVEDADPGGGEGMHKDRLLRTDGKGTVADEFSGIAT
ncbi:snRNA-activating protein complex subunit 4 isoform X2 [Anguilla rostrata]|uniref:snRNA-activating protein complex subunit 4 isoform X2 n=1 Tax=Anguilla rostrata TaxID=7938 RepID=UPI0030CA81FF